MLGQPRNTTGQSNTVWSVKALEMATMHHHHSPSSQTTSGCSFRAPHKSTLRYIYITPVLLQSRKYKRCKKTHPVTLLWTDRLQMLTGNTDDFVLVRHKQRAHAALQTATWCTLGGRTVSCWLLRNKLSVNVARQQLHYQYLKAVCNDCIRRTTRHSTGKRLQWLQHMWNEICSFLPRCM